ncbi:helix-turn-helix domain-containing protein [Nocardioides dongkuii]|uniref:helix-turn-helix domain-containing protein n=1 Tax=Nocardioides dongkuii TaxID=2760089 RepID=UPI0015F97EA2|nr:helix-turn-helix domain-containing protein [Nocardioides dongkuii]
MAILLDTASLPRRDRHEVFRAALAEASGATSVELDPGPDGPSGRMELVELGETRLFTARCSSMVMRRDRRTAGGASPEAVAVAVHGLGVGCHQMGSRQRRLRTGDVMVVDVTRPFDFSWTGLGSSTSLQVPTAALGLPLDLVQRAAPRLGRSPLYDLVSRYLVELARDARRLDDSPTAPAVGAASLQLVRALISSALDDPPHAHDVLEQTLVAQVRAYVRQHLRDPELSADQVAAALSVSRRQLFRACSQAGLSLEQYVIAQRLEGARAELARPSSRPRSVASVAYSWGFKDPTHFTRRFRQAYGMLPRDWRVLTAPART